MKVKMRDNLIPRYIALYPDVVDMPDQETQQFLSNIEGREVDLVFVAGDAFEKNDNDVWLPDCLWDEI